MEAIYERSFERDLRKIRKIRDAKLLERIMQSINAIKSAEGVSQLTGARKIQGTEHYRIRVGDYRIVFGAEGTTANLMHVRHRRDVYRLTRRLDP